MPVIALLGVLTIASWWWLRALGDVRTHLAAFLGCYAAAFAAYLALLRTIHALQRRQPGPVQTRWLLSLIALTAIASRLLLLPTRPTLSDDIYRYVWDGRVQLAGFDPYAYAPSHPALAFLRNQNFSHINFPHLRTIYPPLTQQAFRLSAWLAPTLNAQKIVFVSMELLTCFALWIVLRVRRLSPLWLAAYAWHPLVILEIAGSGHNDALGIALLWVGIAAWQLKRPMGAAISWAMAFVSKYATVILAPWVWCRREQRWMLLIMGMLAAWPIACCPTIVSALWESLSAMTTRFESNASVYLLVSTLVGHAGMARALVIGLWLAWLLWWARREADPVRYFLGGFGVAMLLGPVLHPWYLVWIIPSFCFWRPPVFMALTALVVLAYSVWPGYLAGGTWRLPVWAHITEYGVVAVVALWSYRTWWWPSLSRLATRPQRSVTS